MLGDALRDRRTRLGLSQDDLARAAGIDVKTIRNIEAGRTRPRPSTLRLLAEALGMPEPFALPASEAPAASPAAAVPTPAQLPGDLRFFVGRETQLAALDAALDGVAVISGTAGVGKTALAVHWAHRVRERFPDGQLYVNLRGFGPSGSVVDPVEAISGFLDALDVPAHRVPVGLDAQAALFRSVLAGRRMLIVLDNAKDARQVRPLLPGAPGCAVVVTSRRSLTGLVAADNAHPVVLDLLTPAEAGELLGARLGRHRIAAEPETVHEIVDRCARLPLALVVAAARVATSPGFALRDLADHLRRAQADLDAWAGDDDATDVRTVFSWSYRQLDLAAARLFRLLGVHPGPSLSANAAASLAGVPLGAAERSLRELTGAYLLSEPSPGRYAFHDLLRAYAAELAGAHESEQALRDAVGRVLDFHLHGAFAAALLLSPHRDPVGRPPSGHRPALESLRDDREAMAWFTVEHRVLLGALELAGRHGFDAYVHPLAWTLSDFLQHKGLWQDKAAVHTAALGATRRLGDRHGQAHAHRQLSRVYILMGRLDDAHAHYREALELAVQAGDAAGQAHVHFNVANLNERQGRLGDALDHALKCLDLFTSAGNQSGRARARNMVGWFHARLGRLDLALIHCGLALAELEEIGDDQGQVSTLDSLGYTHHHLGQHEEAIACYRRALALGRQLGERGATAEVLMHLGDAHHSMGEAEAARDVWRDALEIFTELDDPRAGSVATKLAAAHLEPRQ